MSNVASCILDQKFNFVCVRARVREGLSVVEVMMIQTGRRKGWKSAYQAVYRSIKPLHCLFAFLSRAQEWRPSSIQWSCQISLVEWWVQKQYMCGAEKCWNQGWNQLWQGGR